MKISEAERKEVKRMYYAGMNRKDIAEEKRHIETLCRCDH